MRQDSDSSIESTDSRSSVKSKASVGCSSIDYKRECFICERERTTKGNKKMNLVAKADRHME